MTTFELLTMAGQRNPGAIQMVADLIGLGRPDVVKEAVLRCVTGSAFYMCGSEKDGGSKNPDRFLARIIAVSRLVGPTDGEPYDDVCAAIRSVVDGEPTVEVRS